MKKPFGIRLPERQLVILKEIAEREGRSVSDVIRRMIDEDFKKRKIDTGKTERTA